MKKSNGFTMIELLMVMIIIANLGTVAAGQFLDFRKEARIAAVQRTLQTLRVAFKNQEMQARLRCNVGSGDTVTLSGNTYSKAYVGLAWNSNQNDITYFTAGDYRHLCTTDQISNPAERKFWDRVSGMEQGRFIVAGVDVGGSLYPANILNVQTSTTSPCNIWGDDFLLSFGTSDRCVAANAVRALGYACNWLYDYRTGQLWPASNTSGINECYF